MSQLIEKPKPESSFEDVWSDAEVVFQPGITNFKKGFKVKSRHDLKIYHFILITLKYPKNISQQPSNYSKPCLCSITDK